MENNKYPIKVETLNFKKLSMFDYCIITLFLILNFWIVFVDIRERRIPNKLLIYLIILLPIWLYIFPLGTRENLISQAIISLLILIVWIFFYTRDGFLGSWDIKYSAILVLFLGQGSLSLFIGNIWILTIGTLLFLWSVLLGSIYAIYTCNWKNEIKISLLKIKKIKPYDGFIFFLDWIIIWYGISLLIKAISLEIFQFIPTSWDFYFLLSLWIFLLRPWIRSFLLNWKYNIYPIFGVLIYFWLSLQKNGYEILIQDIWIFIKNIWQYALIFTLVNYVTRKTFSLYDSTVEKYKISKKLHTIPFSIIIFLSFCTVFFFNISLTNLLK